ncbi:MAG: hypothetical protein ACT4QG_09045 [Sporichthyaceae bacterium]
MVARGAGGGRRFGAFALAGAVLIAGCGGSESAPEGLGTVVSGEGFSARMPGAPEKTVDSAASAIGTISLTDYVHQVGDEAHRISVSAYPKKAEVNLDIAITSSAESAQGKVIGQSIISYRGKPGRDAQIEAANGSRQLTTWARYFYYEGRLYILQFIEPGHGKTAAPAKFTTFVETFRFE